MTAGLETVFLKARRAQQRGDDAEARRLLEDVLHKYPGNRKAQAGLDRLGGDAGDVLRELAALGDPVAILSKGADLAERFPREPRLWEMLGSAYLAIKDHGQAERMLHVALRNNPRFALAHATLAKVLARQGRPAEARTSAEEAIRLAPDLADAHHALGKVLLDARDYMEATGALLRAIALRPDHFDAIFDLGHALLGMRSYAEAIDAYDQATLVNPASLKALVRLADVLRMAGLLDRAHAALDRATDVDPESPLVWTALLSLEAIMCEWRARHEFAEIAALATGKQAIQPFIALPFMDDPAQQLFHSRQIAQNSYRPIGPAYHTPDRKPGGRIRIGYFSADFHNHATLFLMAGLLREHDRDQFEIRAYSFGGSKGGMRDAILDHVDAFIDIEGLTDAEAVDLARRDALDIAIDLKGYTTDSRVELFAERMAPVQIAYLGYPGSVGADFMDYMIADPVVLPDGYEADYSEKIIRIPGSYQANDNRRAIGSDPGTRASLGLPADGFVFCCFNNNYKIGPDEFDIWMRLLTKVDGSVLWLFEGNDYAAANLRREAAARGVDPDRLVFAAKMDHADHLARHVHADLFLDTFAVNAHTTASDALWAGLPVLTLAGRQFAARVAASLLAAVDLPELITTNAADYEAVALDFARSPAKLAALKAKLAANRLTTPLFDTATHTRHIEAAYTAAHQRRLDGLAPDHITIERG